MPHPAETIASTTAPEPLPNWRPTVRTIERLILDGQTPFLMRRQVTLSLHKEDCRDDKSDEGGTEELTDSGKIIPNPRRAVICSFPQVSGGTRRFNLSLEEADHISSIRQELANLRF